MATAQEVYDAAVETLTPAERLRLARLILDSLTEPAARALAYSDEWSDEDVCDVAAYSLNYAAQLDDEE